MTVQVRTGMNHVWVDTRPFSLLLSTSRLHFAKISKAITSHASMPFSSLYWHVLKDLYKETERIYFSSILLQLPPRSWRGWLLMCKKGKSWVVHLNLSFLLGPFNWMVSITSLLSPIVIGGMDFTHGTWNFVLIQTPFCYFIYLGVEARLLSYP